MQDEELVHEVQVTLHDSHFKVVLFGYVPFKQELFDTQLPLERNSVELVWEQLRQFDAELEHKLQG